MQSATSVFPDVLPRPAMPQTLAPAFAASLAVHAVMLLALVSWVAVGDRVQLPGRDALAVLLVGAPAPAPPEAPPGDHAIAVPAQEAPLLPGPSVPADARSAEPAPPASEVPAATAPAPATPASTRVVSLGTVDVQLLADYLVTSLHPVHEARAASEFPVEVPQGVRLVRQARRQVPGGRARRGQAGLGPGVRHRRRQRRRRGSQHRRRRAGIRADGPGRASGDAFPSGRAMATSRSASTRCCASTSSCRRRAPEPAPSRARGPGTHERATVRRHPRHTTGPDSAAARPAVRYPSIGMWNPGAALPSSGQRVVSVLPRV